MGARRGPNELVATRQSVVSSSAHPVSITDMDVTKPHCFAGVQFYSDAEGTVEAIPTTGTITITVRTVNTSPRYETLLSINVIQAATPTTICWAANTIEVVATPSGVDVAPYYRMTATCNET